MKKIISALVFFSISALVLVKPLVNLSSSVFNHFYNEDIVRQNELVLNADKVERFQHSKNINNFSDSKLFISFYEQFKKNKFKLNESVIDSTKIFSNNSFATSAVLYRPGEKRILVVRKGNNKVKRLNNLFQSLIKHKRFKKVFRNGEPGVYLQIDEIDEPKEIVYATISQTSLDSNRFEFGVDGFRIKSNNRNIYFLPGDAYLFSIHSINHLHNFLKRLVGASELAKASFQRFTADTYIFDGSSIKAFYRGFPVVNSVDDIDLARVAYNSSSYVAKHQDSNGRFLYYYDGKSDSKRDHQHPSRDPNKNPYYNILRHNGGGLLMLHEFERTGDKKFLEAAKKAIEYTVKNIKSYKSENGEDLRELFYNKKSKLGGSGIALYYLVKYQKLSNDNSFKEYIESLKNHLISQILNSGEFIYYRAYLGKVISEKENKANFNFYYPGEALCGLIEYYGEIANKTEKKEMKGKIIKALDFLVNMRPKEYPTYFRSLPSDSWLMMAINRLWDFKELREDRYKDFVISDVNQMIDHMYNRDDSLYPDYPGSFYYNYGDHPYPDGARAEGVLAAYDLSIKLGDKKLTRKIEEAINLISLAVYRLVNIPETAYSVKNPKMSLWAIRFKLTRQWTRVDTIQHVAAFYSKLLFLKKNKVN